MISEKFVILGALLNLAGSLKYVVDTLKGETKPNRVTWFMWSLAPMVAFAAEINRGVGLISLMTFMTGFGPFMILLASFVSKKSTWQITKFDIICGVLSLLGILLWLSAKNANLAIVFSIFADLSAALPTIKKAYRHPETETWQAFFGGAASAFLTLLAIKTWDIAHYAFPAYILSVCVLLVVLVKIRPQKARTVR